MASTIDYEGRDVATQLRDFARVLREQWWIIAVCVVVAGVAAVAYAETRPRDYQASSQLLLLQDNPGSQLSGTPFTYTDPVRQAATDQQLIMSAAIGSRVAHRLHLGPRRQAEISNVGASISGDSNVLTVTVTGRNPKLIARVANAYSSEYVAFRAEQSRRRLTQVLRTLERKIKHVPAADRPALRLQLARASLAVAGGGADAQVMHRAGVPTVTLAPNISRKLVIAVLFGLLLGIALAVIRDRLDPRVKRVADVKGIFPDVALLATIPHPGHRTRGLRMTSEGFRTLQSNVDLLCQNGRTRTLLVTSAGSGDGKSTTVLNLGLAMNEQQHSALVLEADLRRPKLSSGLGLNGSPGLSKVLSGKGALDEAVTHASLAPGSKRNAPPVALAGKLAVVPAGKSPARPRALLSGDALGTLLASASTIGDTILIDGPPIGLFSDMLPLAKRVDGVIVTVRLYHSRKEDLQRFAEQLLQADVRPVGLVVLGSSADPSAYDGY